MEFKQRRLPKYYPKTFSNEFVIHKSYYSIIFTHTKYAILHNWETQERKRKKCSDEDRVRLQVETDYYKIFFNIQ